MAKTSVTIAHGITPEVMQKLNQLYSSKDLRGAQTKLTSTAREIRRLSNGRKIGSGVLGNLSEYLTLEQCHLLQDAANLIDSVNTHVEHAKEKRVRSEKESKRRQDARLARAKQLVASAYPLPAASNEQLLDVIQTALILNRARQYHTVRNANEFNLYVRNELETPARLYGRTPTQYRINNLTSIRYDLIDELTHHIAYDDGSTVEERLQALKEKIAEARAQTALTSDERETLRLWSEALSPDAQQGGGE
ncbi:hypothetical protein [Pseudomonas proteolytica]|uniref:DNA-binding protein n=1 Tax=Pseudomonas proteolytica TaxID=219574 RepID=A0AAW5AEG2_9PSED|nr:hypothetical protein [Pseudomonas proteolytica]KAA8704634.1 hypothetical protein F4W61_06815 [Pseudomonas proteolytica]MCF5059609.1 hypothetical protein [Pseudomonas proteolytica]MCF5099477.1 hypothetical protein [Pseudomonas proteolytica]NMZ06276.1 hypothetical protein [Pseudomonas proteolytica]NMZ10494.1 hypothetical protein [Pseudomonas proteolytica]